MRLLSLLQEAGSHRQPLQVTSELEPEPAEAIQYHEKLELFHIHLLEPEVLFGSVQTDASAGPTGLTSQEQPITLSLPGTGFAPIGQGFRVQWQSTQSL